MQIVEDGLLRCSWEVCSRDEAHPRLIAGWHGFLLLLRLCSVGLILLNAE